MVERRLRVPGGKTLVLFADCEGGRVVRVRLRGDFFLFPEEAISDLEGFVLDHGRWDGEGVAEAIDAFMEQRGIRAVGFTGKDLAFLMRGLRC